MPDGHGNPWQSSRAHDDSLMGYTLRTERWRYTAWFGFDWGENGDPKGVATNPRFDEITARELYDHEGMV